ncbi:hypothetical protein D3H65_24445 [Paraflavitalea soli]|uniref:RHS repeat-associated core domain-containing protein n=1 Tax=Paraflavitalea soli TaxID=2315862 RepID=A0A3B7MQX3_9BACT|nr:RHS repeat-associated core domain-containing protein [Paraflavitalea soli]AXY76944.1 hypothetical protein D3H65_24445 [Paraflavitalea soli]
MVSRVGTSSTGVNYRFGFNGKEADNEVKGWQNQQDYGMRIYDPRVGRFLSVDPLTKQYPWYTPCQFADNMSILHNVRTIASSGVNNGLNGVHKLSNIMEAGMAFVGKNAKKIYAEGGRFIGWESSDGLKLYRPPAYKTGGVAEGSVQANFLQRTSSEYSWTSKSSEAKAHISNTHVNSDAKFNYNAERQ